MMGSRGELKKWEGNNSGGAHHVLLNSIIVIYLNLLFLLNRHDRHIMCFIYTFFEWL